MGDLELEELVDHARRDACRAQKVGGFVPVLPMDRAADLAHRREDQRSSPRRNAIATACERFDARSFWRMCFT